MNRFTSLKHVQYFDAQVPKYESNKKRKEKKTFSLQIFGTCEGPTMFIAFKQSRQKVVWFFGSG